MFARARGGNTDLAMHRGRRADPHRVDRRVGDYLFGRLERPCALPSGRELFRRSMRNVGNRHDAHALLGAVGDVAEHHRVQLADEAGTDKSDSNLSADGSWHQEFPDFSSRRSFSSSRSRLYLVGSSIVLDGGAIGLRIFAINSPARCFFGLRCVILRNWFSLPRRQTCSILIDSVRLERTLSYHMLCFGKIIVYR